MERISNIMKTIGFIGLGLIGGSIARTIRKFHPDYRLLAFDKDRSALAEAIRSEAKFKRCTTAPKCLITTSVSEIPNLASSRARVFLESQSIVLTAIVNSPQPWRDQQPRASTPPLASPRSGGRRASPPRGRPAPALRPGRQKSAGQPPRHRVH